MRIKYACIFLILFLGCSCVWGADFFYCHKTNSTLYLNTSIEAVKQACGEPLTERVEQVTPHGQKEVLEYVYHFQPNSALLKKTLKRVKSALVIDFEEDRIVSILEEGRPVTETHYCRSDCTVRLGDSRRVVGLCCRMPSIKRTVMKNIKKSPVRQTVLTYQQNEYNAPTRLCFDEAKLVKIEKS